MNGYDLRLLDTVGEFVYGPGIGGEVRPTRTPLVARPVNPRQVCRPFTARESVT